MRAGLVVFVVLLGACSRATEVAATDDVGLPDVVVAPQVRVVARVDGAIPDPAGVKPMLFEPPEDILGGRFSGVSPSTELPMVLPEDAAPGDLVEGRAAAALAMDLVAAQSWLEVGIRFYSPTVMLLPPFAGWFVDIHDGAEPGGGLVFDLVTPNGTKVWTLAKVSERGLPRANMRGANEACREPGDRAQPLYARLTVHLREVTYDSAAKTLTIAYAAGHGCGPDGHDLSPQTELVIAGRIPDEALAVIDAMNAGEAEAAALGRACLEGGASALGRVYERVEAVEALGALGPRLRAAAVTCRLAAALARERADPERSVTDDLLVAEHLHPGVIPYEALVMRTSFGSTGYFRPKYIRSTTLDGSLLPDADARSAVAALEREAPSDFARLLTLAGEAATWTLAQVAHGPGASLVLVACTTKFDCRASVVLYTRSGDLPDNTLAATIKRFEVLEVGGREVARVDLGLQYRSSYVDSVVDEHSDEEHSHMFFEEPWHGAMTAVRWLQPEALTGANVLTASSYDEVAAGPANPLGRLHEMDLGGRWLGQKPPVVVP